MEHFIKKNSLMFASLLKLHNKQDCDVIHKKKLKYRKLINSDGSLTVKGNTILYAAMLEMPVLSFKILAFYYVHRRIKTSEELNFELYKIIKSLFGNNQDRHMRRCIKHLIDHNLVERSRRHYLLITNYACDILRQHDADITEIGILFPD